MRFLKPLRRWFVKSSDKLAAQAAQIPLPYARFLFSSSNHFSRAEGRIKKGAFRPPPDLRLSVFRINELNSTETRKLAASEIPDRTPHGWAHFTETTIIQVNRIANGNLSLDKNETPIRHADIIGWPVDKTDQLALAAELANASTLVLFDAST